MAKLLTINLSVLGAEARKQVEALWRLSVSQYLGPLSLKECAMYYGFAYGTIRAYVRDGRLATRGKAKTSSKPGITHAEMRKYLRLRKPGGSKRKALKAAQVEIAVPFVNSAEGKTWDGGPPVRCKYTVKPAATVDSVDPVAEAPAATKDELS